MSFARESAVCRPFESDFWLLAIRWMRLSQWSWRLLSRFIIAGTFWIWFFIIYGFLSFLICFSLCIFSFLCPLIFFKLVLEVHSVPWRSLPNIFSNSRIFFRFSGCISGLLLSCLYLLPFFLQWDLTGSELLQKICCFFLFRPHADFFFLLITLFLAFWLFGSDQDIYTSMTMSIGLILFLCCFVFSFNHLHATKWLCGRGQNICNSHIMSNDGNCLFPIVT